MAEAEGAHGSLSLAQVEEELRSAEAYLTASGAPSRPPAGAVYEDETDVREWAQRNELGLEHEDSNFRRKLKTRPILSEERRREILAKLSSERQAALRARHVGDVDTDTMPIAESTQQQDWFVPVPDERKYKTPEERHQLVQRLLDDRATESAPIPAEGQSMYLEVSPVRSIDVGRDEELHGGCQQYLSGYSDEPSAESDDDDEIYYASDILDNVEYIERIREQLDLEEYGPLSFTPMINPNSREIATNKLAEREADAFIKDRVGKPRSQKVTDRLAEDADAAADRRLATQEYFDMLNEQPFAPKISETSKRIVEQKPEFKMDFVARQQYFQSRDQEKMEALEEFSDMDYARGERLTFTPDIGNAEGVLQQLRPDRCSESNQQKLYRLTYNDQRDAELKKQRLREEQYAQYTFKPEINPVSKALGRPSTLNELSHPVRDIQQDSPASKRSPPQDRRKAGDSSASRVALRQYFANKRFRSRVALEMEEASKAECTFQPTLIASKNRNSSVGTNKLYSREPRSRTKLEWQSENLLHLIEAERQKKADEIEAKRNAQELKELEECTFRPNIQKPRRRGTSAKGSPSPPRDSDAEDKPVIVRGLGRFLELRELARQQQAEQKQREQKVFSPNTSYEPRSYTVPKPFKLSESNKDSIRRRLKVREEMRAKEREECTFKPRTVSSQSRRVLKNMLNN
ncbi:hypothetical protein PF003_g22640 [Phytophthora fragariae]|nr:hypothetical protein PF003_g22640 [Phytophthora fragariae]